MWRSIRHPGRPVIWSMLLAAGCGGAGSGGGGVWQGTIDDSAGIEVVQNPEQGLWANDEAWRLTRILEIGSAEGDPDYQFGQVAGVVAGADGRIYVLDQQAAEIRVFDHEGTYRQTIGRKGQGPGEISPQAVGLIRGRGDTLFVADMGNTRVDRFLEDGSDAGSFPLDFSKGIPVRWEGTAGGTMVTQLRHFALPGAASVASDSMDAIVAYASDGTVRDTLLLVPAGETFSAGGGAPEFHFFSPEPVWALAGDGGVWYGINNEYRVFRYDDAGRLIRIVTKSFETKPVTATDREVFEQALEKAWRDAGVGPQVLAALKAGVDFEDRFPAYFQLRGGPGGSLWVQHLIAPAELSEAERETFNPQLGLGSSRWDVFDGTGRFLGGITMPERFQPLQFEGNTVYGVWRDDLDVQYVRAYRIEGAPTGDLSGT